MLNDIATFLLTLKNWVVVLITTGILCVNLWSHLAQQGGIRLFYLQVLNFDMCVCVCCLTS